MNEERRQDYPEILLDLQEVKEGIKSTNKLLLGNGKIGVAEMARRAFEYMQCNKETKNGLLDWAFRVSIMIVLGFIAVKVGLK